MIAGLAVIAACAWAIVALAVISDAARHREQRQRFTDPLPRYQPLRTVTVARRGHHPDAPAGGTRVPAPPVPPAFDRWTVSGPSHD